MNFFFFYKQKTAYELRISDWSSDVCSSDLPPSGCPVRRAFPGAPAGDPVSESVAPARGSPGRRGWTGCDADAIVRPIPGRSEERRAGKDAVLTCTTRGSADH